MKSWQRYSLILISWSVVAFGQPAWSSWLGVVAAACGYALFWRMLFSVPGRTIGAIFVRASLWFAVVQAVQLSWLATDQYFGGLIYLVYLGLALAMGALFGLLSLALWLGMQKKFDGYLIFGIAGLWVLLEWSRLFVFTGFPWNPVGMALTGSFWSLQMVSFGGIYGLSFWVMLTNMVLLWCWQKKSSRRWMTWGLIALFPYLVGGVLVHREKEQLASAPTFSVVLVSTSRPPLDLNLESQEKTRQYWMQAWEEVVVALAEYQKEKVDLIVFPETAFPYGPYGALYLRHEVEEVFARYLGSKSSRESQQEAVGNAFWAEQLALYFNCQVVLGVEASWCDGQSSVKVYNAALAFTPGKAIPEKYGKQVLVPMGEYIPYDWCRRLLASYGIYDSFSAGEKPGVFFGPVPLGVSICMEELYGNLVRQEVQEGAHVLLNLSNDAWFPSSKLGWQHFYHGRIRAVENGVPLVRACNMGVSCGVDSLGRILGWISAPKESSASQGLLVPLPLYKKATFYTRWGDAPVVAGCLFFTLIFGVMRIRPSQFYVDKK